MRRPAQQTLVPLHLPAPVGGLNTVASGTAMPEGDCVQLWNLVSGEHGLRARLGYRLWFNSTLVAPHSRGILPFVGSAGDGANDRIFITHKGGIRARTPFTSSDPILFASTSDVSGYGVSHAFTTSAGHFLLYCDEENGYHVYTESSGTWAKVAFGGGAGEVTGVDPSNLCFVMVWKSRVWFVEKDTNNAWYLPAGAIYGTAVKLNLDRSAQFRAGGDLVGLWNWTLDGGSGIDDFLVAVSRGGDVAVYQGTDPASATTFSLKGTWSAGAMVAGRKVATSFGGDVLLLTKSGLRPLSQLVAGGDGMGTYATAKIANLFNALTLQRGELPGWDMCIHPEENALIITVPIPGADAFGNYETEQLVLSLWNRSWSRFRDLPIQAMGVWQKKLFFGDRDGNLWINDGYLDGHHGSVNPTNFTEVQWELLTSFRNLGSVQLKQVQIVRPLIVSEGAQPTFKVEARYNYNLRSLEELTYVGAEHPDVWGSGLWGSATWRSNYLAHRPTRGTSGMGTEFAIAIRGASRARTALVGMDVMLNQGGLL